LVNPKHNLVNQFYIALNPYLNKRKCINVAC